MLHELHTIRRFLGVEHIRGWAEEEAAGLVGSILSTLVIEWIVLPNLYPRIGPGSIPGIVL